MGGILYEGIFEFLKRVDIIGNIVNQLPIIGPIRQTILNEFKSTLDRTLGPQVKTFLSTFNRVAVQRMVEFVLSKDNREGLMKANRNLAESILNRPVCEIMLNQQDSERTKKFLFSSISNASEQDLVNAVNTAYDKVGEVSLGKYFDIASLMNAVPSVDENVDAAIHRFFESPYGKKTLELIKNS